MKNDLWLYHPCRNDACWFYCTTVLNNCDNSDMDEIEGCAPRVRHKEMLNTIMGKEAADLYCETGDYAKSTITTEEEQEELRQPPIVRG